MIMMRLRKLQNVETSEDIHTDDGLFSDLGDDKQHESPCRQSLKFLQENLSDAKLKSKASVALGILLALVYISYHSLYIVYRKEVKEESHHRQKSFAFLQSKNEYNTI